MITIDRGTVNIAYEDTENNRLLEKTNKRALELAIIDTDLSCLFATLISEYGKGKTATIIEVALKTGEALAEGIADCQ